MIRFLPVHVEMLVDCGPHNEYGSQFNTMEEVELTELRKLGLVELMETGIYRRTKLGDQLFGELVGRAQYCMEMLYGELPDRNTQSSRR